MTRLAATVLACHVLWSVSVGAGEHASDPTEPAGSKAPVVAGPVRGDVDGDG